MHRQRDRDLQHHNGGKHLQAGAGFLRRAPSDLSHPSNRVLFVATAPRSPACGIPHNAHAQTRPATKKYSAKRKTLNGHRNFAMNGTTFSKKSSAPRKHQRHHLPTKAAEITAAAPPHPPAQTRSRQPATKPAPGKKTAPPTRQKKMLPEKIPPAPPANPPAPRYRTARTSAKVPPPASSTPPPHATAAKPAASPPPPAIMSRNPQRNQQGRPRPFAAKT